MKLQILDLAQQDLITGYHFYEEQEIGLGDYFLNSLYSDIDALTLHAPYHRKVYKDFYWSLSKRFPFAIYYTIETNIVRVRSVIDCRRDPTWIREHLSFA